MKSILLIASFNSGSTYFQRAATFWIRELIDQSICNPHELLNGLAMRDDYLVKQWMGVCDQSLSTIQHLIENCNRPVVARLAYDHWLLRNESGEDFFKFLNQHFDVYISHRADLFDYGMCHAVRRCTDRAPQHQINNVHSPEERARLYGKHLTYTVDPDLVIEQAHKYLKYFDWACQNFPDAVIVDYDRISDNIDRVLQEYWPATTTIEQKFGISIADYSQYLYQLSNNQAGHYSAEQISAVAQITDTVDRMCQDQIMLDPIPIKSTTISDKMHLVSNFEQCRALFDRWVAKKQHRKTS
jgi:hypothetical protein